MFSHQQFLDLQESVLDYLNDHIQFESLLMNYLYSQSEQVEQRRSTLLKFIKDHNYIDDRHEFEQILYLLSYLSTHRRGNGFLDRIIQLIVEFKEAITKHQYTNEQLFNKFKNCGPVVLALQENGIIHFDEEINSLISEDCILKAFYQPESDDVNHKRNTGENINEICEIIRSDDVSKFQQFIAENNINLDAVIPKSNFETNAFLQNQGLVT